MRVKYVGEGMNPLVGTTVVNKNSYSIVRNMNKLEEMVDLGYEFIIKEEGKEIDAEEYFKDEEKDKVKVTSDITVEEENVVEEETFEEDEEEASFNQCQATTSSGSQCSNEAKYPEEDPKYCGIHKNKLES